MAQVKIPSQKATSASAELALTAANAGTYPTGGNSYANGAATILLVENGDASAHTLTVSWVVDGATVTRTQAIAAGKTRVFSFDPKFYGSTINIHFDAVTDVAVAVLN